jgi:hypothetical protein
MDEAAPETMRKCASTGIHLSSVAYSELDRSRLNFLKQETEPEPHSDDFQNFTLLKPKEMNRNRG